VSYVAKGGVPQPPGPACFASSSGSADIRLTGNIDELNNTTLYTSRDGSCSGPSVGNETIVSAATHAEAVTKCEGLASGFFEAFHVKTDTVGGLPYPAVRSDWWGCF
jgi:hypothetical protein